MATSPRGVVVVGGVAAGLAALARKRTDRLAHVRPTLVGVALRKGREQLRVARLVERGLVGGVELLHRFPLGARRLVRGRVGTGATADRDDPRADDLAVDRARP